MVRLPSSSTTYPCIGTRVVDGKTNGTAIPMGLLAMLPTQDLTLYVDAWFPGDADARGVFSASVNVQGHWFFGVAAALDDSSLCDAADENGVIAAYDWDDPTNEWPNPFCVFRRLAQNCQPRMCCCPLPIPAPPAVP